MTKRQATLWTFAVTSIALFMVVLDNLVVSTALPVIRVDLGASIEELEWTVNAYTLTFAVFLLTGAALGDRFGRKRMFMIGIGDLHRGVGVRGARAVVGLADRGPRGPGHRRRDRDAADADDPQRRRARASGAAPRSARGPASPGSPSRIGPARRRRRRRRASRGSGSSGSTSRSGSSLLPLATAPDRVLRAGQGARPARPRARERGPARRSSGASSTATAHGWTSPEIVAALAVGAVLLAAFVALGAARAGADAADALLPRTARSRPPTARRSSCTSGCSARSSC